MQGGLLGRLFQPAGTARVGLPQFPAELLTIGLPHNVIEGYMVAIPSLSGILYDPPERTGARGYSLNSIETPDPSPGWYATQESTSLLFQGLHPIYLFL